VDTTFSPKHRSENYASNGVLMPIHVMLYVGRLSPEKEVHDLESYAAMQNIQQHKTKLVLWRWPRSCSKALPEAKILFLRVV
jgi:hypothetical protein